MTPELRVLRFGVNAHPTTLLPFGWLPVGVCHGDDQDEDQVLDDDLVIALDDACGAVVLHEPAHEELEKVDELAPSEHSGQLLPAGATCPGTWRDGHLGRAMRARMLRR